MIVYKAKQPLKQWAESLAWCREQFGGTGDPYVEYSGHQVGIDTTNLTWWERQNHYFFRNEKDYMWYCLRWGDYNDR